MQAQEKALCIHEFGFNSPCRYNNEVPSPLCGMDRNDYDEAQVLAVFLRIPPKPTSPPSPFLCLMLYHRRCKHKHKTICGKDVTIAKVLLTGAEGEPRTRS